MSNYTPATRPTLYFIGVSTAQSSIMKVFPAWANYLGLKDAEIKGIDFPIQADPASYRDAVEFIKTDPLSLGALVTTHKIDLYRACHDLFDEIDPYALAMHETSCISKRDKKLICHAKDPISSGLALDGFLPQNHFATTEADMFVMGAGGSAIAMTAYMMKPEREANRPKRIVVSDRSQQRLDEIRRVHSQAKPNIAKPNIAKPDIALDCVLCTGEFDNDDILAALKPGSLVVNATGLGKDGPGSPLTEAAIFPQDGIVWELNYRGNLVFLQQAKRQQLQRNLQVEAGWTYFIYGWTQVISEVFNIAIATSGPQFAAISAIASQATKA